MTQRERLQYLIQYLLRENSGYAFPAVPDLEPEQKRLLRSLMNVRPPLPVSEEFLRIQDGYLKEEQSKKKLTAVEELKPAQGNLYVWQGDITTLRADAIVNAANSALLGCFIPCHGCIDNAIHSAAGVQLRLECRRIMNEQGSEEPVGKVKVTGAYNLPSKYILHTVGPFISGELRQEDCRQLASCYRSCLDAAASLALESIAFCCISTGEFHFPNDKAAQIAVETVKKYLEETGYEMKVIFNVFKDEDDAVYRRLLG